MHQNIPHCPRNPQLFCAGGGEGRDTLRSQGLGFSSTANSTCGIVSTDTVPSRFSTGDVWPDSYRSGIPNTGRPVHPPTL